jgi:hypothetical protein
MKEAAKLPPEKIFQAYFENSLEDVKELQGFGFSMLNVEVCIRFQSDKEIVLKNKEQYEVVNSRDAGEMEFQKKPNIKEIAGDLLPDWARDRQFPRKTKINQLIFFKKGDINLICSYSSFAFLISNNFALIKNS